MAKSKVSPATNPLAEWAAPQLRAEIARLNGLLEQCGENPFAGGLPPQEVRVQRKSRKPMSDAAKKAASKRMKAYWAAKRKADKA